MGWGDSSAIVQSGQHTGKLIRSDAEQRSAAFHKAADVDGMGQFIPPPLLDSLEHTRRNLQPGGNIFNGKALFHAPFTQTGSQFFQCHDIPALENFIIDSCPADLLFLPGHRHTPALWTQRDTSRKAV